MIDQMDRFQSISDGFQSWQQRCLRFGDTMPALCYIHDIGWNDLCLQFPDCYQHVHPGLNENHCYTWQEQIDFVLAMRKRIPKKVIDVGGGRGEFANVCKFLGIDVVSIEPHPGAHTWYKETAKHFFGTEFDQVVPKNNLISESLSGDIWEDVDTVVLIESLEHLEETEWLKVWPIIASISGLKLVITNYVFWHPIAQQLEIGHVKSVDDNLYDQLYRSSKSCSWRMGSHIVLNF
jgi:2-polyprenyl-3-methyl-5-hydroxy-6-metoxy-1,4-benzoquinol methylase